MRVELRLERDEHEYVVTLECDQAMDTRETLHLAATTMLSLTTRLREREDSGPRGPIHESEAEMDAAWSKDEQRYIP